MPSGNTIKVVGLNEFRKGLRGIDRGLPKSMRLALNEVADELVSAVRPQVPHLTGRAAASLKAQSSQSEARIAAGGSKAPHYPWLDFGGRTGRRKSVVRPFFSDGRYIFPTLAGRRAAIEGTMLRALVELASANGIAVD